MTRLRLTTKQRLHIFETHGGRCHLCGLKITAGDRWDIDHIIPLVLGGADAIDNLAPAHERCHRDKTAKQDVPAIAKSERVRARHLGAHRSRTPMPGSRASGWKKRMDGSVVRRT